MKISIVTKIFALFALVILMFAGVSFYAVKELRHIGQSLYDVNEGFVPLTRVIARLDTAQKNQSIDIQKVFEAREPYVRGVLVRLVLKYFPQVLQRQIGQSFAHCTRMELVTRDPERLAFVRQLRTRLKSVEAREKELESIAQDVLGRISREEGWMPSEEQEQAVRLAERNFAREIQQVDDFLDREISRNVSRVEQQGDRAMWAATILTFAALILGLALTLLSLLTLKPIRGLTAAARRIGTGDYSQPIEVRSTDELGVLAQEFDTMRRTLQHREQVLQQKQEELSRTLDDLRTLTIHYRNILKNLWLGVLVTDEKGHLRTFNPSSARLWERDLETFMGRPVGELPLKEHQTLGERIDIDQALRARRSMTLEAVELSEERRVDLAAVPFLDETGVSKGMLLIVEDVTQRLITAEKLLHSERLAAVGRIAARITHEIRNPLSALGLNVEMLEDELDDYSRRDDVLPMLRIITKEVDRLHQITEDYLHFARTPNRKPAMVNLVTVIEETVRLLSPECQSRNVDCELKVTEAEMMSWADENQVIQALQNLMRNAMEAMPDGGELRVSMERQDGEIVVSVADRGQAIPENLREKIWEPFFSTKETGTGLGLAMTRQIVQEHGGQLTYRAREGGGSILSMSFPTVEETKKA